MSVLYSVGHSTRSLEQLVDVLQAHSIANLVDIRSYPASRRLPHFNREKLERELPQHQIRYLWEPQLGGRRKRTRSDSPHTALRSESFRNYADHTLTPEFRDAIQGVLQLADQAPTAVMCAEKMYFQCHRMIVSDYVVAHGGKVLHIIDQGPPREHRLSAAGQIVNGELIYSVGELF